MRSSSGEYYEKLDHVRALAAFLVFSWHFTHTVGVPFEHVPAFAPLSIFEEGHTGVALFMTLSGYLFAKLLYGKQIDKGRFLRNRAIRLVPLLTVALALFAAAQIFHGDSPAAVAYRLLIGAVYPSWPNGAWSVAVEFHFYLLLPLLLFAIRRGRDWAILFIVAGLAIRTAIWWIHGDVQVAAAWTIIGRLDQFVLGIYAFHLFRLRQVPVLLTVAAMVAFFGFFDWFNRTGGFNGHFGSPAWIYLTTVEGCFYAIMIAAYDKSRFVLPAGISRKLAFVGTVSYSIYLLHFYYFYSAAWLTITLVGPLDYPAALAASLVAFIAFLPIAALSYRTIEAPFLKLRTRYASDQGRANMYERPATAADQLPQT